MSFKPTYFIVMFLVGAAVPAVVMFSTGAQNVAYLALGIPLVVLVVLWFTLFRRMFRSQRVLKTGEPGTAKVLSLRDTGVTVNNQPMVKLELEVTPERGAMFRATAKALVPRINPGIYGVGTVVKVMIDPADRTFVVVAGLAEQEAWV